MRGNHHKREGSIMTEKHENDKNLREVEREQQEGKNNQSANDQSIADQSRVPNEQHRLKDKENLRK